MWCRWKNNSNKRIFFKRNVFGQKLVGGLKGIERSSQLDEGLTKIFLLKILNKNRPISWFISIKDKHMAPIDSSGVSLAAGLRWFCKLCTRVHNSKVRARVSSGSKFACVFWKLLLKISQFRVKIVLQLQQNLAKKNHFTTWKSMLLKLPNSIQRQFFPVLHNFCAIFSQFVSQNGFSYISHNFTSNNSTPNNTVSYKLHFLLGYISY